jgi:hypothetical protein
MSSSRRVLKRSATSLPMVCSLTIDNATDSIFRYELENVPVNQNPHNVFSIAEHSKIQHQNTIGLWIKIHLNPRLQYRSFIKKICLSRYMNFLIRYFRPTPCLLVPLDFVVFFCSMSGTIILGILVDILFYFYHGIEDLTPTHFKY